MSEIEWNKLGAYLKETQILGSIQSTLYWDQNTGMPKKGASWRSEQLTYIAKILHERNSSKLFGDLIKAAQDELLVCEETLKSKEIICLKYLSCRNFVRTENHIPAPKQSAIRGLLQIIEFKLLTISSIKIFPQMLLR